MLIAISATNDGRCYGLGRIITCNLYNDINSIEEGTVTADGCVDVRARLVPYQTGSAWSGHLGCGCCPGESLQFAAVWSTSHFHDRVQTGVDGTSRGPGNVLWINGVTGLEQMMAASFAMLQSSLPPITTGSSPEGLINHRPHASFRGPRG